MSTDRRLASVMTRDGDAAAAFFAWQVEARKTLLRSVAAGGVPRRFAAHLPVLITFDPESPFGLRTATKGAGLLPHGDALPRYLALLEETLARCVGRPYEETLGERVAAVSALLDHAEDVDRSALGFLEIMRGKSYENLRRDPRVVLHYVGDGPDYRSFQVNGEAEVLERDDPRCRYIALARAIFETAPFHLTQPGYVGGYLVRVREVIDKTPVVVAPDASRFSVSAARAPQDGDGAPRPAPDGPAALVRFREILVAVDNSRHSAWATERALEVAALFGATVAGSHVYAARLHDRRFKDMEPGLPDRYQEPAILARQRELHDTLIDRGLLLVSDSYLDVVRRRCAERGIRFVPRAEEGKNYAELVRDIERNGYDLVVLGARGMGARGPKRATHPHRVTLGSVCERVTRRARRDVLVVKDDRKLTGAFVVGVDGSERSFAALRIALAIAARTRAGVQAVACYDPYLHKVLFHELERALTDEAREVFNTEQQKRLHDTLIDSGVAKIYRDHLAAAKRIADEAGVALETHLLAGKPSVAILRHLERARPSLLALGRTGVHADEDLDIGSTAENLLRLAPCHVLLAARTFRAPEWPHEREPERLAWTPEAVARLERVPEFARGMARRAIEDYARERGLAHVDEQVVADARAHFGI